MPVIKLSLSVRPTSPTDHDCLNTILERNISLAPATLFNEIQDMAKMAVLEATATMLREAVYENDAGDFLVDFSINDEPVTNDSIDFCYLVAFPKINPTASLQNIIKSCSGEPSTYHDNLCLTLYRQILNSKHFKNIRIENSDDT